MDKPPQPLKFRPRLVPHPRSPAARFLDWSSVGLPHPDSPAARHYAWVSLIDSPHPNSPSGRELHWVSRTTGSEQTKSEELKRAIAELDAGIATHSNNLRDALPDQALRELYDRQVGILKGSYDFAKALAITGIAPTHVMQSVQRQMDWVHCHLHGTLTNSYEIAAQPILDEVHSLRNRAAVEDTPRLLGNIQALAQRYYDTAARSIQEHWADAKRTGKQEELIRRWRARMLRCASAGSAASAGPAVEEPPAKKAPKSSDSSVGKTWVAFQLVDQYGTPVANASYEVTLTDGSIKSGDLDDQGLARFDDIDPGQCKISFPKIDAREWQ
jgi:hypothetical protein